MVGAVDVGVDVAEVASYVALLPIFAASASVQMISAFMGKFSGGVHLKPETWIAVDISFLLVSHVVLACYLNVLNGNCFLNHLV